MKGFRIAIIGAGRVGATTAYTIMQHNLASEIILIDANDRRCSGEIFDLSDALAFCQTSSIKSGCTSDARDADIIIITAGIAQTPNQTRLELLQTNAKIMHDIFAQLKPINPEALIIMVTNPVDIMTCLAQKLSGLPHAQVFGSGTLLDSERLRFLLAQKLNISLQSINAYILGEHGDTQFPAWSSADIGGKPITQYPGITQKELDELAETTKKRAYEIIACKGYTAWGVASCVTELCKSIIFDQKRVIPVASFQESLGVCLSMPAIIGMHGIEGFVEIPLNSQEKEQLEKSAQALRESMKDI